MVTGLALAALLLYFPSHIFHAKSTCDTSLISAGVSHTGFPAVLWMLCWGQGGETHIIVPCSPDLLWIHRTATEQPSSGSAAASKARGGSRGLGSFWGRYLKGFLTIFFSEGLIFIISCSLKMDFGPSKGHCLSVYSYENVVTAVLIK